MAITTPASVTVTPASGFQLPAMDAEPLHTTLNNGNYLYLHHIPALVSVSPISTTTNRDRSYVIPIYPSADGLPYSFHHRILPAFNGTCTVQVEWAATMAGAWTSIYGPTATAAMTSGTWLRHAHVTTIPATARILRVTYTAFGGNAFIGNIFARPQPSSAALPFIAPYGATASGFRVYEDSLLYNGGATGQPVNTEMLDRCRRSEVKVLRDRQQMAFSLVQDRGGGYAVNYTTTGAASFAEKMAIGQTRFTIPALKNGATGNLTVYVIASVSAGTTANLVTVKIGNTGATFAADGVCNSATVAVTGDVNDVRVEVGRDGVNTTSLHACVGFWTPGV